MYIAKEFADDDVFADEGKSKIWRVSLKVLDFATAKKISPLSLLIRLKIN